MKYIKTFESINKDKPEVGDYVICDSTIDDYVICDSTNFVSLRELVQNSIGKITIIKSVFFWDEFYIEYGDLIGDIMFVEEEILFWSKNKEELELILTTKKYNL